MSKKSLPYEELSAYVDGEVDGQGREELARLIASDPDAYHYVQACKAQQYALHAEFDACLSEPVPPRLLAAFGRESARHEKLTLAGRLQAMIGMWWNSGSLQLAPRAVAGCAMVLLCLGAIGPTIYERVSDQPQRVQLRAFSQQAALAHAAFTPEIRHPVEVSSDDTAHLGAWLSTRLGRQIAFPDFTEHGYHLLGGRLLPGKAGAPAAQVMYEDKRGRRVTLFIRAMSTVDKNAPPTFSLDRESNVHTVGWMDESWAYALSGVEDTNRASQMVDRVRKSYRSLI